MRWLESVTDSIGHKSDQTLIVEDRGAWHGTVHGIAELTRLSD